MDLGTRLAGARAVYGLGTRLHGIYAVLDLELYSFYTRDFASSRAGYGFRDALGWGARAGYGFGDTLA